LNIKLCNKINFTNYEIIWHYIFLVPNDSHGDMWHSCQWIQMFKEIWYKLEIADSGGASRNPSLNINILLLFLKIFRIINKDLLTENIQKRKLIFCIWTPEHAIIRRVYMSKSETGPSDNYSMLNDVPNCFTYTSIEYLYLHDLLVCVA